MGEAGEFGLSQMNTYLGVEPRLSLRLDIRKLVTNTGMRVDDVISGSVYSR